MRWCPGFYCAPQIRYQIFAVTIYSPCGSEIVESMGIDGDPECDIFVSRSTRADNDSSSTISSTGQMGAKSPAVTTSLIIRRASFLFSRGLSALFCTCRLRLTGAPGRRSGIEDGAPASARLANLIVARRKECLCRPRVAAARYKRLSTAAS